MNDISELETRITTALARISAGLSALPAQRAALDEEIAQLKAAQDEETAQLKAAQDEEIAQLKAVQDEETAQLKAAQDEEIARLNVELEEERVVNSQLGERLQTVQQARTDEVSGLRSDLDRAAQQLSRDGNVIARLRAANAELRSNNDALRAAVEAGVADGDLVNRAMDAELGGLRAAQAADRAELDAILGALSQLMGETDPSDANPQKETNNA